MNKEQKFLEAQKLYQKQIAKLESKIAEMQDEKDELISKYRYFKGECAELKKEIETASNLICDRNQTAIEELEKVKEKVNCEMAIREGDMCEQTEDVCVLIAEQINQQITELKRRKEKMSSLYSQLENLYDQDFMESTEGGPVLDWLRKHKEDIHNIEVDYLNDIATAQENVDKLEKEVKQLYPFVKEYNNGTFIEYNVVQEREGFVSTTAFGKNKELAYNYLKWIKGEKVYE